jgi:hypothetical protein
MAAPRQVTINDDLQPVELRTVGWALVLSQTCLVALGCGAIAIALTQPWPDRLWEPLIPVGLGLWLYSAAIAPRIRLDASDLTLVGLFRRRTFPLRDVVSASSGYYGISIRLTNDGYASSNIGQTMNYTRWRGRVSRGDRIAGLIQHRSAMARGETPGPLVLTGQRGTGNWTGAISALVAALFRAGH